MKGFRRAVMTRSTLVLAGIVSCSPSEKSMEESSWVPLVDLAKLSQIEAEFDPLATHRPSSIECNALGGWYLEDDVLEVNSGKCNYLALGQPALISASAGTPLATEITFFDLTAPEPAQAHLALWGREAVLWETTIDIPAEADVLQVRFELPFAIERGEPVGFHLHNHGQNTYRLSPLLVLKEVPPAD